MQTDRATGTVETVTTGQSLKLESTFPIDYIS